MINRAENISVYQSLVNKSASATDYIVKSIRNASNATGIDFSYLLSNAIQESSLNPKAKASTSSATGIFQFIEQTWLRVVKTYGGKYGLGDLANRITIGVDGIARVSDCSTKKAILDLRCDPRISACMAAEFTRENKEILESKTGGKIGATELYLAHFLGASGAATFINAMRENPNIPAAEILPEAATVNKAIFYGENGKPKTLGEIYDRFAKKFNHPISIASAFTPKGEKSSRQYHSAESPSSLQENEINIDNNAASFFISQNNFIHKTRVNNSNRINSTFTAMVLASNMDTTNLLGDVQFVNGAELDFMNEEDEERSNHLKAKG